MPRTLTPYFAKTPLRSLLFYDMFHELRRNGLEIDRVCNICRGLDRCDIRIDEHRLDTFFLQCLQCLSTTIIKLSCLTDFEGTAAEKEDLLGAFRHLTVWLFGYVGFFSQTTKRSTFQQADKFIKHPFRVSWPGASLGVELSREPRHCLVADAFVGAVVHVYEQRFPVGRQCGCVNGITMILACDEAACATYKLYRLIMTAMAIFQLVCLCTCRPCQELIAKTDAHEGPDVRIT